MALVAGVPGLGASFADELARGAEPLLIAEAGPLEETGVAALRHGVQVQTRRSTLQDPASWTGRSRAGLEIGLLVCDPRRRTPQISRC